jgi:flagellar hook capping protein FlgD
MPMLRARWVSLALVLVAWLAGTPAAAQAPPTPTNFTATTPGCTEILLSWSDVAGETAYEIYRDGSPNLLALVSADVTSYIDHVAAGEPHSYCLVAKNVDGNSSPVCATATFPTSALAVEAKNWLQDTFTSNETITAMTFPPYDTTSAWIRTGLNLAQFTGAATRQDLPGDTVVCEAAGSNLRLDLVFRIVPGVGNYVTIGNRASGLRRVPTSATAAVANAASANFWESFLADNGAVGTSGNGTNGPGHPSGKWDPNVWNSARCDTAETNLFPVEARGNLPGILPARWASMYHEADPKFLTLGVPKNRCFLVNPAGAINSTNITCGSGTYPPPWAPAAGLAPSEGGLAPGVTREFSQIIPDGQLTPGSHVEYFLRSSDASAPLVALSANPDTNLVLPQPGCVIDCSRWAQFGVLPDRWKDPFFSAGGTGMAGMLVVDMDDGRGDECAWVSVADSIGLTTRIKVGAHNGWGRATPGADVNDPAYFVRAHLGQPGTCWDFYSVSGSRDTLTGNAGSLGSRLAPRCSGCPSSGRESRQGPTLTMLQSFYRVVTLLTGGRAVAILGPFTDRGQDEVTLLQSYLTLPGGTPQPRGLWVEGNGFAESEGPEHHAFLQLFLRTTLRTADYPWLSGNSSASVTLTVPAPSLAQYGLLSDGLDVLLPQTPAPAGLANAYYENVGSNGPYVASVYKPASGGASPYISLLDGFDLRDLGSVGNVNTTGRQNYVKRALQTPFGGILYCPQGDIGVPEEGLEPFAFLSLRNNPLTRGAASIELSLAKADRVKIAIHDIAGRVVAVLADRVFDAGPHELAWDGSDASGRRVANGVYFVRARTGSGLGEAKTLVVLH